MYTEQLKALRQDITTSLTEESLDHLEPLRGGHMLITGGTGFVGTWLSELAAYLNDVLGFRLRVTLLARETSDFTLTAPHLAARPEFDLIREDVRNLRDIPLDVAWIVHAGATPDNRLHNTDPLRTADSIVNGTRAVLEAAVRLPMLSGLLNISSGLVYGPQPVTLEGISEEDFHGFDPSTFGSVYAESKRMAENLCAAYANQQRLRIVTARPFAFIGPYQHLDRPWAINNFVRDSVQGGPIRILGDGETVRSYMYPADMAVWMLAMLAGGVSGESYNVGSPQAVTLRAAAELVADQFSPRPKINTSLLPAKHQEHSRFVPNVSRAQKTLRLDIKFDLKAAIRRTLEWNAG